MSDVRIMSLATDEASLPVFRDFEKRLEAVRERAYDLFLSRNGAAGSDFDDWVQAERELLGSARGEMTEHEGEYEVDVTLPGFDADEVELSATPRELLVHATTTNEKTRDDADVMSREFSSSEVYRRFSLPTPVEIQRISAELKDGVLKVHAPKSTAPLTFASQGEPASVPIGNGSKAMREMAAR
jgi:HSP20 family molecular chaperone IbpA